MLYASNLKIIFVIYSLYVPLSSQDYFFFNLSTSGQTYDGRYVLYLLKTGPSPLGYPSPRALHRQTVALVTASQDYI